MTKTTKCADVKGQLLDKNDCNLKYSVSRIFPEEEDEKVKVYLHTATTWYDDYFYTVYDGSGRMLKSKTKIKTVSTTLDVPYNAVIIIDADVLYPSDDYQRIFNVYGPASIIINSEDAIKQDAQSVVANIAAWEAAAKDSLYADLEKQASSFQFGKCMWDKSARLVLVRTIAETGQSSEFIIPQDSIFRQEDGSWIARYTDVADRACTHYNYAVRIDQTHSDLHMQDPENQLKPIALSGPNLYFDEGAEIATFTATQGDAHTELKSGVLLNWAPTSSAVDSYVLQRRVMNSDAVADTVYTGTENTYFDRTAVPDVHYEYIVTALYDCNGKFTSNYATTEGWRTPYGEISGNIIMSDNSGMNGVEVALQAADGTILRTMVTSATGIYRFDSLLYDIQGHTDFVVIPTHTYGQFSFNYTSAGTAAVTLSPDNAVALAIDFMNISTVRITGRVLYKNSTIPVAGALFLLDNDTVRRGMTPLQTAIDGTFELVVAKSQPHTLRVIKEGHIFEGDGILRVENDEEQFALTKALDGVRFYDETKVRLVGRVAGGNDQRDLKEAFGLGTNNLGENLQLVLQLEGDNTAQIVHDPNDLERDTIEQVLSHSVLSVPTDEYSVAPPETISVGQTNTLFEKKRIIIHPDPETGEYQVDLFPVKYKVVQASARGYATLFTAGQGSETFDLTNAPLTLIRDSIDTRGAMLYTQYNATYDRIFHNPVQVELVQNIYGIERDGFGEPEMEVSSLDPEAKEKVKLYYKQEDGTVAYTLGYPAYYTGRKYQFKARAYEDYYFNNDTQAGQLDRVPQRGGRDTVHNGLESTTASYTYELDNAGINNAIWLSVEALDIESQGENTLHAVSVALEQEGNTVETNVFQAFTVGSKVVEKSLRSTQADIRLLDIIRDPGGAGSSAYVESGSTYTFGLKTTTKAKFGVILSPTWGLKVTTDVGVITATGSALGAITGSYIGAPYETKKEFSFNIPVIHEFDFGTEHVYTVATTDRISTSSSATKSGVGSNADVFMGTTVSQITGTAKTITIIGDSLYRQRKPAIDAGAMLVLAHGVDAEGKPYHLVTGQKIVLGTTLNNTFVYTQRYIYETLIPQLALERQNLLMSFNSAEEAQAAANASGRPVYWYHETGNYINDTLPEKTYDMFTPDGDGVFVNEVDAINNMLLKWMTILVQNEREKLEARIKGTMVGTYSASYGTNFTHSDSYTSTNSYNEVPQGSILQKNSLKAGGEIFRSVLKGVKTLVKDFITAGDKFGKSAADALNDFYTQQQANISNDNPDADPNKRPQKNPEEIGTKTNSSEFQMKFEPIFDMTYEERKTKTTAVNKKTGFTLAADPKGDITVSVYRAEWDSTWLAKTEDVRDIVGVTNNDMTKYGSYVFSTEAGSSFCPHEAEERSRFYNKGSILNNGTKWVMKPELSAETYEIANVAPDKRATFRITLKNNGEVETGVAAEGERFSLFLDAPSNPDGAKIYVDGAPISTNPTFWIRPGEPITKTLEVERGTVDDYNLTIGLLVLDCYKTNTTMDLAVHFLPVSTDVEIAMPRQNWVMNTLSQRDSAGYYLPVEIDGFDIHHKNFDHIEFQYKLSTESEERWVNQCSFYADDSLYALASGNKAMIENGRITPFRFYGERDPMEQKYDLRAVSFCRYGSGFVTKNSPVISGVKDTRPPRVFGQPEPANSILGIGDNLLLRFNEPIAGNYLDEDNNFQLMGVTNETGITAGTSLSFDGSDGSYAATKVGRSLFNGSFTIDLMVKPENTNRDEVFFKYSVENKYPFEFGKTASNRLYIKGGDNTFLSKPLPDQLMEFTRLLVVYNKEANSLRFYMGNKEIEREDDRTISNDFSFNLASPLVFGQGYKGDMLEARVWTKALTQEEITATANRYLTGFERELLAYYRMSEGRGETVNDRANGATLYLYGTSWNKQKGFSLAFDGTQTAQLNGNLLSRSKVYDFTMMFWFRTTTPNAPLFSSAELSVLTDNYADNEWHHYVLSVNRTFNTASVFIDGQLVRSTSSDEVSALSGAMYLGGEGFTGMIDEFAIFEQALPQSLVETYDAISPMGDEMGLMAYLPFEEQILNPNGILELVFSVNDQREFKNPVTGEVIEKVVPLVLNDPMELDQMEGDVNAPVSDYGKLTKLYFDWAFNGDELMINILNQEREVNKQSMFITVRDVEDLNGNPMMSPVTWTAFVDRNSLKWEDDDLEIYEVRDPDENTQWSYTTVQIINNSGKRHQYTIESLPEWLTVDQPYGVIQPMEDKLITFNYPTKFPVGEYIDIVYLTDENGLSEPLEVRYTVKAFPPYADVDRGKYPLTMSVCGKVVINGVVASDPEDRVYAIYRNECVGLSYVNFDNLTNSSELYLTIYGNETMNDKTIKFVLWQASTGKTLALTPSQTIRFRSGSVKGCRDEEPVMFVSSGSEVQAVTLRPGWNWVSFNIDLQPATGAISQIFSATDPWTEGDLIKNPATQHFVTYSEENEAFAGHFGYLRYIYTYMIYCKNGNTIRVSGNPLPADSAHVLLRGNGVWTPLPYLLQQGAPVTAVLADYYEHATEGDLIKSHDAFAVFSKNGKWVGDLTTLHPGGGYFFQRIGQGDVDVRFYENYISNAPKKANSPQQTPGNHWSNPAAATNMTMIAKVQSDDVPCTKVMVYIGDELVSEAKPIAVGEETYFFLTIQSDRSGAMLRFQTEDGIPLNAVISSFSSEAEAHSVIYRPDAHLGSLKAPVRLQTDANTLPYKVIENDQVIVIRNNEKYSITGAKLQ